MFAKIIRFLQLKVISDWYIKLIHAALVISAIYWLVGDIQQNVTAFAETLPSIGETLVNSNPKYTVYQVQLLILTGFFLILSFNISYIIRNWTWDVVTQFLPVTILNVLFYYGFINQSTIPVNELNNLLLGNAVFTSSVRLSRADRDHSFITEVFGNYVNPVLLENILARRKTPKMSGELREMTVMFSDIRGFTTLSESLAPKRLLEILNYYLEAMSTVVLENKGTIDKFIGDAIMAFWNAPVKDNHHVDNALNTAMAMSIQLTRIRQEVPELHNANIGIGITTGPMVVGSVGGHARFDYTVIGDTVNLGSRLESLTKQYKVMILVSENVVKQSRSDKIIFRLIDEIIVKGKTRSVKIYEPMFDNPNNRLLINEYNKALLLFRNGDNQNSIQTFHALASRGDGPSMVMLDRLKEYASNQRAPLVWQWESK